MNKKKTHGGKRLGSGRPQKEPTKVYRLPIRLEPMIMDLLRDSIKLEKAKKDATKK